MWKNNFSAGAIKSGFRKTRIVPFFNHVALLVLEALVNYGDLITENNWYISQLVLQKNRINENRLLNWNAETENIQVFEGEDTVSYNFYCGVEDSKEVLNDSSTANEVHSRSNLSASPKSRKSHCIFWRGRWNSGNNESVASCARFYLFHGLCRTRQTCIDQFFKAPE